MLCESREADCPAPKVANRANGLIAPHHQRLSVGSGDRRTGRDSAGEAPAARLLKADASARASAALRGITVLYLAVWLVAGLAAFIVGFLQHPDLLAPLKDLGNQSDNVDEAAKLIG